MNVSNLLTIHSVVVKIISQNLEKCKTHGGTRGKAGGLTITYIVKKCVYIHEASPWLHFAT